VGAGERNLHAIPFFPRLAAFYDHTVAATQFSRDFLLGLSGLKKCDNFFD